MKTQEGTSAIPPHIAVPQGACEAARDIMTRVGDKWSMFIIKTLGGGPLRFNELKRQVGGITQRMLTLTLRSLERDGLVARKVYPTVPPAVEYRLTKLGETLLDPVTALVAWAIRSKSKVDKARRVFDRRRPAH